MGRRATRGRHEQADDALTSAREEELVRSLYAEHAEGLLVFVLRLTGGDRQRAEDVVQETLLRAWRHAHELGANGQTSLRPWLVAGAPPLLVRGGPPPQPPPPAAPAAPPARP